MSNEQNGISSFPVFFIRHQGLQMSSALAVATSDLFFYYMLFQLDILLCLGFDSSGYSESVKGQIIFQRVRTPFTRLL